MVMAVSKVLPLYLLPSVDWFVDAIAGTSIMIGEEEQFTKQTFRNRLAYGTFQGTKTFSIPLVQSTTSAGYKKVSISYDTNWPQQLVNALRTAYGKSPFFEYYGYRFEAIFLKRPEKLFTLNLGLLSEIMNCLKIDTTIVIENSKAISLEFYQVFSEKTAFQPHLTILDLIYNEGPDALGVLNQMKANKVNPEII